MHHISKSRINNPTGRELPDRAEDIDGGGANTDVSMIDGSGDTGEGEESFIYAVRDSLDLRYVFPHALCICCLIVTSWTGWERKDERTWGSRIQAALTNWADVFAEMVEAYIGWKYPPVLEANTCPSPLSTATKATKEPSPSFEAPTSHSTLGEHDVPTVTTLPEPMMTHDVDDQDTAASAQDPQYDFFIRVIDIYTLEEVVEIKPLASTKSGAAALVMQGYIGASPVKPSLAISIKTLELFRRLRLRKASLSAEAFAKVICDYYLVRCLIC